MVRAEVAVSAIIGAHFELNKDQQQLYLYFHSCVSLKTTKLIYYINNIYIRKNFQKIHSGICRYSSAN